MVRHMSAVAWHSLLLLINFAHGAHFCYAENADKSDGKLNMNTTTAFRTQAVVQPGGIIHIQDAHLVPGNLAEVIIFETTQFSEKQKGVMDFFGAAKGNFNSTKEADLFLRKERDKWI